MTTELSISSAPNAADVRQAVTRPHSRRAFVALALIGGAAALAAVLTLRGSDEPATNYITRTVDTGDITSTATATGNLEPRAEVTVGAEISGIIKTVDVVDSQVVEAGQLLATFDITDLESELDLAEATLRSSNASVRRSLATYDEAVAERARTQSLVDRGVTARADLDSASATVVRGKADLDAARANAERSKASVAEVKTKLTKAEIRSPIAGVIMQRNVEPGQTVASSLQAPELFVVAEDLSRMNLQIWIDEADIGVVKPGLEATFEVAAYPNRKFDAVVATVDVSPTTTDNVVTYETLLTVENEDGLLRPGMSATATITTKNHENVMRVPNAALRFNPSAGEADSGPAFSLVPTRPGGNRRRNSDSDDGAQKGRGRVHVLRAGQLETVQVRTGATDGTYTEVISDKLSVGDEVVVGVGTEADSGGSAKRNDSRGGKQ